MSAAPRNKAATLARLCHAIFQLEEERGHMKWKVQELSRRAKLSRSLVYEYLGKNKKEILVSALRHFIHEFYGFGQGRASGSFSARIRDARKRMIHFPDAVLFYQKWRSREGWIQAEFVAVEEEFRKLIASANPRLSSRQVLATHVFIHGLVTAPFLNEKQAAEISADQFVIRPQ